MTENENTSPAGDQDILDDDSTQTAKKPAHSDNADPVSPPAYTRQMPGYVTFTAKLEVHTRNAQRLVYGRKEDKQRNLHSIIGMYRFATNVGNICDASSANDPYADRCLLAIEQKYDLATEALTNEVEFLKDILDGYQNISISDPGSSKPVVAELSFRTPYAHLAAKLITNFDAVIGLALVARDTASIGAEDFSRINKRCGNKVRSTMHEVFNYRATGVTRDDFAAKNQSALRAIEKYEAVAKGYSILSPELLDGTKRPKFAPHILSSGAVNYSRDNEESFVTSAIESDNLAETGTDVGK